MALGVFNVGRIRRCYKRLRKIISGLDSRHKTRLWTAVVLMTLSVEISVESLFKGVKNKMNLQNGIYKMVAVQCLKAVITPEIGLRYFCDENHSILVNGLKSDNPLVKKQILEVMCGLSLYSYFEYFSYTATQTSRHGINTARSWLSLSIIGV